MNNDFECLAGHFFSNLIFRQADFECEECGAWNRFFIPYFSSFEGGCKYLQCSVCGKLNPWQFTASFERPYDNRRRLNDEDLK